MSEQDRSAEIDALIAQLQETGEWPRQIRAVRRLGEIGDLRAVDPLIAVLRDEDWRVRRDAADALGKLADVRAVKSLTAALYDKNAQVRQSATQALAQIDTPRARFAVAFGQLRMRVRNALVNLIVFVITKGWNILTSLVFSPITLFRKIRFLFSRNSQRDEPEEISCSFERVPEPAKPRRFLGVAPSPAELEESAEEETEAKPRGGDLFGESAATSYGAAPPPAPAAQPAPAPQEAAKPAPAPEPEPEAARREARKPANRRAAPGEVASQEAVEVGADQPPHFAAFYPAQVAPAHNYTLMVFAHIESARAQIEQIAANFAHLMGDRQTSKSAPSKHAIAVGSKLTVVPQIPGLVFAPPMQVTPWVPPYVSFTFTFETPAALAADLTGRILVLDGALIAGEIPITMQIATADADASPDLNKSAEMTTLDPVFASYSHRDTPVMEYFRKTRARLGQKMLVDVYDLRAGEHWADRLLEMIDQSAVFQLFWSAHSAQSTYCRQEWEHALALMAQRPRFVQPVYWVKPGPTPPPPPELAELHFQHIPLPPLTRMQMVAAQIRRALGLR